MEVEEQQQQWQKQEEVEMAEEEMTLQGRRGRKLAATAIRVSEGSSSDKMLPTSDTVNESQEEEESRQEELRDGNTDNSEVELELDWQQKSENDARSGDEMLPSLETIHGFQEQEELLQSDNKVQLDSQQKWDNNVYYEEDEGTESISRYSENGNNGMRGHASEKNLGDHGFIATITKVDSQRDANVSRFELQPPEKSSEEHETNKSFGDVIEARDEIVLIKEIDKELTELDVERVIEKQDTHDLYCPNCNSCITRRVILRKRKCRIHISADDPKRNKLETVIASELDGIAANATNAADISLDGSMEAAADDYNSVREPEIFRYLSCFSFFIPSGKGFTLFKKFSDESEKENIQSPQPISSVKKIWHSSIFGFRKEETLTEQGSSLEAYEEENIVGASKQEVASPTLSLGAQGLAYSSTAEPQISGVGIVLTATQGPKMLMEFKAGDMINKEAGEYEEITEKVNILADFPHQNGQKIATMLPTSSVVEARNIEVKISGNETSYSYEASQHAIIGTKVDIHIEETLKSEKGNFSLSDGSLLQDTQVNITKDPAKSSASDLSLTTSSHQGGDTFITIKGHVEPAASQEVQDTITSPETVPLLRIDSADFRGSQGLEIIKSTVYGGLMESIASLGIVSSAAGADATTLNILSLALANLVGGLFIIGHNLWELKNNQSEVASEQATTRLNQYQELLGQRENFLLHATVAILSFLIFGLIPLVVYGFSFRVSDNMDHKLIAVAVASLLCIIILAIGKAYVQRPPKAYVNTAIYYVIMGFMTSGVSYAVGDLIKKLVDKLGWFDSDSALVLTLPVLGA